MKTTKFAVIKAKYRSALYGGGYCKPGDIIVMFPRNVFEGQSGGKKSFSNTYVKLNDLHKFPEFSDIRKAIIDKHHINPDTYCITKTICRGSGFYSRSH